jgi:hypothetical protein
MHSTNLDSPQKCHPDRSPQLLSTPCAIFIIPGAGTSTAVREAGLTTKSGCLSELLALLSSARRPVLKPLPCLPKIGAHERTIAYMNSESGFRLSLKLSLCTGLYRLVRRSVSMPSNGREPRAIQEAKRHPPSPYVDSFFFLLEELVGQNPNALRAKLAI